MARLHFHSAGILLAGLILAGCATRSAKSSFEDIQRQYHGQTGGRLQWDRTPAGTPELAATVSNLLHAPLNVETAAQVALLNNQGLQASFEEIGISHADLIQAARLANPGLSGAAGFSDQSGARTRIDLSVTQDLLDALALPIRKRVAAGNLDATQSRLAHEAFQLATEAKSAAYAFQARSKAMPILKDLADADACEEELARLQREAGNISDLDYLTRRAAAMDSRITLAKARAQLRADRERINRLLGLDDRDTGWTFEELPPLPENPPSENLEARAVQQRFDLQSLRTEYTSLVLALGLTKRYRFVGGLEFGVNAERDTDNAHILGPSVTVQIPVFDQGQARVERMDAALRRAEKRLAEKTVDIRSEVREARDLLLASRELAVLYRDRILPENERLMQEALLHYNGMLLGAYQLIETRKQGLETEYQYLMSLLDYWQARTQLERAVGGRLTGPDRPPSPSGQSLSLTIRGASRGEEAAP